MDQQDESKKLHAIRIKRLKFASEAYADHKAIFTDPLTDEPMEGYKPWQEFRDEFIADWISNRRPIDEKEDQVIVDKLAEDALSELDGAPSDLGSVVDALEQVETLDEATQAFDTAISATDAPIVPSTIPVDEATTAPKRRGRPPGVKNKVIAVEANDAGTVELVDAAPKRRGRPPGSGKKAAVVKSKSVKKTVKAKAAAKKGKSTSERAAEIVAWGQSRKWSRKDILERLVARIDGLGAAYASTLYSKFAK